MEFVAPVGEEILPSAQENGLVGVLHSDYYNKERWNYSYERRRLSTAFIPYWQGKYYFRVLCWEERKMIFCNCVRFVIK